MREISLCGTPGAFGELSLGEVLLLAQRTDVLRQHEVGPEGLQLGNGPRALGLGFALYFLDEIAELRPYAGRSYVAQVESPC